MIKVAIIGAGKGGSALLDIFHTNGEVKVVGITDRDRSAPGLILAEQWGIVIADDINEICQHKPDIVINATGKPETSELIKETFPYKVEIIDGTVGKLMWELVVRQQKARKDVEALAVEKIKLLHDLEDSLNYLQGVLDDSQDMIITTDTEGKIVKFSKGGERILGYTMDKVIGKAVSDLYTDKKERVHIAEILKKKGAIFNHETVLLDSSGMPKDISLTISELRDKRGNIIGTVGVSKDITEEKILRKELENTNIELEELNERLEEKVLDRTKELERANKELKKANELKGRFIANASHELRTPLNSIIGFSDVLLGKSFGALTEKQEKYINTILTSGKHLLHLVNNILDLAKIEAGKADLSYETFKVKDVINEVVMVLKPLIDRKVITLDTDVADEVDMFTADKVKFKQVLYNLLSNAVKFTPDDGKVKVKVEKFANNGRLPWTSNDQEFLCISVMDTGPGIMPEDMDRIFDEFEQLDQSKSTEGTGLGLSLTRKLVELHGGHISVESEYGNGALFNVHLPFAIDMETIKEPQNTIPPIELPWMKDEGPVVLVVEDDLPTSELLTIYLSQAGYKVSHAYDGLEAIQKARDEKPFAITLDVMLPKKDGWEVLQSLKTDPATRDIPVIIQSIIENKELAIALGATDYLVKPVNKDILIGKLGEFPQVARSKWRQPMSILAITTDEDFLNCLHTALDKESRESFLAHSAADAEEGIILALTVKPNIIIVDAGIANGGYNAIRKIKDNPALTDIPVIALTHRDLSKDDKLAMTGQIEGILNKDALNSVELVEHLRHLEALYPNKAGLIDEATGLFNFRYFNIRLAQESKRAKRYKTPLVLLFLDVDHFDNYKSKKGEHYGNLASRKVAELVNKHIRGSDVLVRYKGNSFAVILTNTSLFSGINLAKRFVSMIHDYPFLHEEVQPNGKITISIGISDYNGQSQEELRRLAESALQSSMEKGGNRVEVYQ